MNGMVEIREVPGYDIEVKFQGVGTANRHVRFTVEEFANLEKAIAERAVKAEVMRLEKEAKEAEAKYDSAAHNVTAAQIALESKLFELKKARERLVAL